jgi:hypothetical protein
MRYDEMTFDLKISIFKTHNNAHPGCATQTILLL